MISKRIIILTPIILITVFLVLYGYFYLFKNKMTSPQVIPPEKTELSEKFNIIHYDYSQIQWPIDINGKIAYLVFRGDEAKIFYDGKEYLKFDRLNGWPAKLLNINGKIGYILKRDNKNFVGLEGKIISKGYDKIEKIFTEPDNTIYLKVINKGNQFIVKNGEIIYPDANGSDIELTNENKVAILLKYPHELQFIYDNKQYRFPGATFLGSINVLNGKLIYLLGENGKLILVYGDEKIKDERGDITTYRIINNELAYNRQQTTNGVRRIVYRGQVIGENYWAVLFGVDSNLITNTLAYVAITKDNKYAIIVNEKIIGRLYGEIEETALYREISRRRPIMIDNKVAFVAKENNEEFVVYNGEELPHYKTIDFLTSVNNKLVFVATDKDFNSYLFIEK